MGRTIVKLTEGDQSWYLEWSSIVDAPVTFGMPLEDFKEYYMEEYGRSGYQDLEGRLERVEAYGTSNRRDLSASDTISFNRAGKNETVLSVPQIIEYYCKLRDDVNLPVGKTFEELEDGD